MVAKAVLGDILGVGYAVDPRVQGTISLASGRAVPKSDLLYVLESVLRMNNIVLVRDGGANYRLIPLGDATGGGNTDFDRRPYRTRLRRFRRYVATCFRCPPW